MIKIIAASGGGASDSRLIDEVFVSLIEDGKKTLYIPVALDENSHPYQTCYQWLNSVYEPLGLRNIELWVDLALDVQLDLTAYTAVYIGGGNTLSSY